MDLYLVLDLSVSVAQNVDYEKCVKVNRAFDFAETLIKEIDKNEVAVHLVSDLLGLCTNFLHLDLPCGFAYFGQIQHQGSVVGSFTIQEVIFNFAFLLFPKFSAIAPKENQPIFAASDYRALRDLIKSHKTSYNYEVLMVTDLSEEIPFPDVLKLPCLLRFVLLTDFNNDNEHLSENLVATLECVSLNCGLEAMFAQSVDELNGELHFPLMIGDYENEKELAKVLSQETRTVKDVTITLNQSITLKVSSMRLDNAVCEIFEF
jgi:hypothetical protein